MKGMKKRGLKGAYKISGAGSPVMKEAEATKSGFQAGGRVAGDVMGGMSKKRLDKRARGGGVGKSPMSSGASLKAPESGGAGAGHEGTRPK